MGGGNVKTFLIRALTALLLLAALLASPFGVAENQPRVRPAAFVRFTGARPGLADSVQVRATVDAQGNVAGVRTAGVDRLQAARATEAVRKWKFRPGSRSIQVKIFIAGAAAR